MSRRAESERLFAEAKAHLAGGVNSPVRAYGDFDFAPPFITRALGSRIWDADGNEYIDYVGSWGPTILGHAYPAVVDAIKKAAERGISFGAPTERETELAALIKGAFPSVELVRLVNSGTEAVMSAVRAARGYTGRDNIIKFNGCYHGHADHLLVKAGSGAASFGTPDSAGVPADFAGHTLIAGYNNLGDVEDLVDRHGNDIAAIIVEPVAGNMGCVPPEPGFLGGLRFICDAHGIILIFDEVITGFRVAFGGAQELYGVRPDLTCLGKIIGGGLPVGAYGGRRDIMEMVAPLGPVYQAGTLSGNPLAVAAGLATLGVLRSSTPHPNPLPNGERGVDLPLPSGERAGVRGNIYSLLNNMAKRLATSISEVFKNKDIPHTINRVGSMFSIFFTADRVRCLADAQRASKDAFNKFFVHALQNGIYFAPSPFESAFLGLAHSDEDIENTVLALSGLRLSGN